MHVGIFGGSFDPPHIAHSIIAETVRCVFDLELVLWVPTFAPPHKPASRLAPFTDRLAMVRHAISLHSAFQVSDIEASLPSPTYTIRMIQALRKQYEHARFSLIIGSDSLVQFHLWSDPELISKECELLVYPRMGYPIEEIQIPEYLQNQVQWVTAPLLSISGEYVRQCCMEHKSIRYLVSESVRHYVIKHQLYSTVDGGSIQT